jgi:hypothetical protein
VEFPEVPVVATNPQHIFGNLGDAGIDTRGTERETGEAGEHAESDVNSELTVDFPSASTTLDFTVLEESFVSDIVHQRCGPIQFEIIS